jgi:hypothetical protein
MGIGVKMTYKPPTALAFPDGFRVTEILIILYFLNEIQAVFRQAAFLVSAIAVLPKSSGPLPIFWKNNKYHRQGIFPSLNLV